MFILGKFFNNLRIFHQDIARNLKKGAIFAHNLCKKIIKFNCLTDTKHVSL